MNRERRPCFLMVGVPQAAVRRVIPVPVGERGWTPVSPESRFLNRPIAKPGDLPIVAPTIQK